MALEEDILKKKIKRSDNNFIIIFNNKIMDNEIKKLEYRREREILEINKKYDKLILNLKEKNKLIKKKLKIQVWDTYIGKEKTGKCFCCSENISVKDFECGHLKSIKNGGKTILNNLRPICITCNKFIGTNNMYIFKNKFSKEDTLFHTIINNSINLIKKI